MKKPNKNNLLYCLVLILFLSCLCFAPVKAQHNVSLLISPESDSFSVGSNFEVYLNIVTEGVLINAAQGKISFPTDKLEVVNISKDDSVFSIWAEEPNYSNKEGKISFTGGLPSPGFSDKGNILKIVFRAKESGDFKLFFSDEAKVLANDGLGTNVLTFLNIPKYSIYEPEALEKQINLENKIIFSSTHPNSEDWYSNNNPRLQWNITKETEGISFVLDKDPDTIPDNISEGLISLKDYKEISDGTWYFHLKINEKNTWGEVQNYKLKIDTTPPHFFEITIDNAGDSTNPRPKLYFETKDNVSKINKYEIKLGEKDFVDLLLAQINPFSVPPQKPGNYEIIVRAQDEAGNIVRSDAGLTIDPIETPIINIWPKRFISGQETFYLEGTAVQNSIITILLEKHGEEIKVWQTSSDDDGFWFFSSEELIKPGEYDLMVMAEDEREAISNFSNAEQVNVSFNGLILVGLLITFESLTWFAIIILVLSVLFLSWFIYKNLQTKNALKKETQEAKDSLLQSFASLEEEIREKVEFLDSKPGLNEEERIIYEDIKASFNNARESIQKEIQDIEKELK
ncbi:cohesin domain-containing protein [Patescibacteria group bacterium]